MIPVGQRPKDLPNDHIVYQQFPPTGPMQTAWLLTFNHALKKGLFITSAYFKAGPDRPWMKVLHKAEVSEIFVPYQSGTWRFRDFETYDFALIPVAQQDAGRCGALLAPQPVRLRDGRQLNGPFVVRELTEKGVLWKRDRQVYRGHKMTLWGTVGAENYNYIISYAFHDDGQIEFRGGATSQNWPQAPWEPHMHTLFWRVDIDINGSNNTVNVNRHLENTKQVNWQDCQLPFNGGVEGGLQWNAPEFTTLHITGEGMEKTHAGYMVLPLYRGVQRHQEPWTQWDAWVTKYRDEQETYRIQQMGQIIRRESIMNQDLVLWVSTSLLHLPRNEDGRCARVVKAKNGREICNAWHGSAVAMWTGFDMKPHNIFPSTPFTPGMSGPASWRTAYIPPRCPAPAQQKKR